MNFYKDCIRSEVYGGMKLNVVQRFKVRTFNPALNSVYLMRMYQYHIHKKGKIHHSLGKIYYRKLFTKYNIFLRDTTIIGKGVHFPHPTGIILGEWVVLGENCYIYQHVTIGSAKSGDVQLKHQPHIGNNCTLFAGSCVLGNIIVSDNTVVGCNSTLTVDTPPNVSCVGYNRIIEK